jgi:hypothetical protein
MKSILYLSLSASWISRRGRMVSMKTINMTWARIVPPAF